MKSHDEPFQPLQERRLTCHGKAEPPDCSDWSVEPSRNSCILISLAGSFARTPSKSTRERANLDLSIDLGIDLGIWCRFCSGVRQ